MAAVRLFGFSKKTELLKIHPSDIYSRKQDCERDSYEKAEEMMMTAYEKGVNKFEWIHKRANDETFPAEVWLTAIPYKNKKALELMYAGANSSLYIIRKKEFPKNEMQDKVPDREVNPKIKFHTYIKCDDNKFKEKKYTPKDFYIIEFKPDRQPIGIYLTEKPFTNHKIQLQKGDILYAFSDGYVDQFNGITKEKFNYKRFRNMLLSIANKFLF